MHRTSNYLTHRACTELSRRGFLMLCMNTRYENNEALVDFEKLPLDVKAGVEFLRRQPGITKVVLFAHSGGGPLMALYQAVAENGPVLLQGRRTSSPNAATISPACRAPTASCSPTRIRATRSTRCAGSTRRSPTRTTRPTRRSIAELNPFDPKNGFNPNGPSNYSPEFQARYFKAQADRMNRLIDIARDKLARMKRNDYPYPDDDIMVIPRGGNPGSGPGASAALFIAQPDIAAVNSTARPREASAQRRHDRDAGDQERLRRRPEARRATTCASAPAPRSTRCARS